MSQRVGGSLRREGSYREMCRWEQNHSVQEARYGEKANIGRRCWDKNHNVLVACFVEKAVIERRVLVGVTSQRVGGSLWREGSYRETCWEQNHSVLVARLGEVAAIGRRVGGSKTIACWWLALSRKQLY